MSLIGLYLDSEDAAWSSVWGCTSAAGTVMPMQTPGATVTLTGTNVGEVRDGYTVGDFVPVVPITLITDGAQYSLPAGVVTTVMRRKLGNQAARWAVATDDGIPAGAIPAPVTGASVASAAGVVSATGAAAALVSGSSVPSAAGLVAAAAGVVVTATVTGASVGSAAGSVTATAVSTPSALRFTGLTNGVVESGSGPYTYTQTAPGAYQRGNLVAENLRMPANAVSSFVVRTFVTTPAGGVDPYIQVSLVSSDTTTAPSAPFGDSAGLVTRVNRGNGATFLGSDAPGAPILSTSGAPAYARFTRAADGTVTIDGSLNGTDWAPFGSVASTAASPLWPRVCMFSNAAGHVLGVEIVSQTGMEAS
jgi:hypothetical protein